MSIFHVLCVYVTHCMNFACYCFVKMFYILILKCVNKSENKSYGIVIVSKSSCCGQYDVCKGLINCTGNMSYKYSSKGVNVGN